MGCQFRDSTHPKGRRYPRLAIPPRSATPSDKARFHWQSLLSTAFSNIGNLTIRMQYNCPFLRSWKTRIWEMTRLRRHLPGAPLDACIAGIRLGPCAHTVAMASTRSRTFGTCTSQTTRQPLRTNYERRKMVHIDKLVTVWVFSRDNIADFSESSLPQSFVKSSPTGTLAQAVPRTSSTKCSAIVRGSR